MTITPETIDEMERWGGAPSDPRDVLALIAAHREQSETIARQAARIEALEAGLRPFTVEMPPYCLPDHWRQYGKRLTCGDIRRAAELLTDSEGGQSDD